MFLSHMAESSGVIFFNVDYRLAPEAKCPENVKDFYSALKYVVSRTCFCLFFYVKQFSIEPNFYCFQNCSDHKDQPIRL